MASEGFEAKFVEVLASGQRILGTVMLNSSPFADAIKCQPRVNLITVGRENYQQVLAELLDWLKL